MWNAAIVNTLPLLCYCSCCCYCHNTAATAPATAQQARVGQVEKERDALQARVGQLEQQLQEAPQAEPWQAQEEVAATVGAAREAADQQRLQWRGLWWRCWRRLVQEAAQWQEQLQERLQLQRQQQERLQRQRQPQGQLQRQEQLQRLSGQLRL